MLLLHNLLGILYAFDAPLFWGFRAKKHLYAVAVSIAILAVVLFSDAICLARRVIRLALGIL